MLALRRAALGRSAGSWEAVHGHVELGEHPVAGALRELKEETGAVPERLYNLSRAESIYLHRLDQIVGVPAFAARLHPDVIPSLSDEHDSWRWIPAEQAGAELAWPRAHRAIADLAVLLKHGDAGALEDVLRITL